MKTEMKHKENVTIYVRRIFVVIVWLQYLPRKNCYYTAAVAFFATKKHIKLLFNITLPNDIKTLPRNCKGNAGK
jgi:hypothetical protein